MKDWIYFALLLTVLTGCSMCNNEADDILAVDSTSDTTGQLMLSPEVMGDIISSIPSPLEIAALIKSSGKNLNKDILNPAGNRDRYVTNFKKAANLGIYGADLGYINMYSEFSLALKYLGAVKHLADGLNVGHFFDFALLKDLASKSGNADSLMYISTSSFEKMDRYLQERGRSNLSVMILTGGWLEALYISTQVADFDKNPELVERIGEQKITLNELVLLLAHYLNDPEVLSFSRQLAELKLIYDEVEIDYIYEEPTTMEEDGMLIIVDNSRSEIKISIEQFTGIKELVNNIRQTITK